MAEVDTLPAVVQKQIDAVTKPFFAFAKAYGDLAVTRAKLAPQFMKACAGWQAETSGTFVEFVRLLDPTVPADREARKAHKVYNAAEYLRRLITRRDVGGAATKPVRSRLSDLARLIKTLIPIVRDEQALWQGISVELGLAPRQITRLRKEVAAVEPILDLRRVTPQPVKVVHMATAPPVTTAAPAAATVRRSRAA